MFLHVWFLKTLSGFRLTFVLCFTGAELWFLFLQDFLKTYHMGRNQVAGFPVRGTGAAGSHVCLFYLRFTTRELRFLFLQVETMFYLRLTFDPF